MIALPPAHLHGRLRDVFIAESGRTLQNMRQGLCRPSLAAPQIEALRRDAHALHGTAVMLGYEILARLAAAVEGCAEGPESQVVIAGSLLRGAIQVLELLVVAVANDMRGPEDRALNLAEALEAAREPQCAA